MSAAAMGCPSEEPDLLGLFAGDRGITDEPVPFPQPATVLSRLDHAESKTQFEQHRGPRSNS